MSRYIDADALKKDVENFPNCYNGWSDTYDKSFIIGAIEEQPSIDIVFCKECKHRPIKEDAGGADHGFNLITPNELGRCPCLVDDGWYSWMPDDNFYCGYGERREP